LMSYNFNEVVSFFIPFLLLTSCLIGRKSQWNLCSCQSRRFYQYNEKCKQMFSFYQDSNFYFFSVFLRTSSSNASWTRCFKIKRKQRHENNKYQLNVRVTLRKCHGSFSWFVPQLFLILECHFFVCSFIL
jgi:hypothetical protein